MATFMKDLITSRIPKELGKTDKSSVICCILGFVCATGLGLITWLSVRCGGSTSQNNFHPRNVSVNETTPNTLSGSSEEELPSPEVTTLTILSAVSVPPNPVGSAGTPTSTKVTRTETPPSSRTGFPTEKVVPSKSADPPISIIITSTAEATSKTDGDLVPTKAAKLPGDAAGANSFSNTQPLPTTTPLPSTIESSIEDYADPQPSFSPEAQETAPSENSLSVDTICRMASQKMSYAYHEEPSDDGTSIAAAHEASSVGWLCRKYLDECHRLPLFRNDVDCRVQESTIIITSELGKVLPLLMKKDMEQDYSNEHYH